MAAAAPKSTPADKASAAAAPTDSPAAPTVAAVGEDDEFEDFPADGQLFLSCFFLS